MENRIVYARQFRSSFAATGHIKKSLNFVLKKNVHDFYSNCQKKSRNLKEALTIRDAVMNYGIDFNLIEGSFTIN